MRREWSLKDSFLHTEEGVSHAMPLGRGARGEAPGLISRQRKWEEHMSQNLIMVSAGKDKARQSKTSRYKNSQCEYFQGALGLS